MPTILREQGFRFHLYLNDHLPVHVHVSKGGAEAKVQLEPAVELSKNSGFKMQEIKRIVNIITANYDYFIQQWYETYNQ